MKRIGIAVVVASSLCACADDPAVTPGSDAGSSNDGSSVPDGNAQSDAAPPTDGAPPSASGLWSMGYYAGYEAAKYPVAEIGWSGMTHLAVAFYLPDGNGGLDESLFQSATEGPKLGHALVDAAHKAGKKAVASVGGAGMHDAFVASASNANRAKFVARIKKLVTDYGYDGVDLDWEPVTTADEPTLVALAKELRTAMPTTLLTIPIGTVNHNLKEDLSWAPKVAAVVDQFNLMSYSMAGAYQGWKSWHAAPLHWNGDGATPTGIDDSVDAFLAAGVPAAKLGLGSGFYGLCYTAPVNAPVQVLNGSTIKASDGAMSYANIMTQYWTAQAAKFDATAKVPWLGFAQPTGPQGCSYVSYEDAQSLAEKGAWAKSKKLGGIIVWTINQGYLPAAPQGQRNPLLTAIEAAFLK
jgi:chitinase